jgi:hypothetical protein
LRVGRWTVQGRTGDVPGTIERLETDVHDRGRRRRVSEQRYQVGRWQGFRLLPWLAGMSGQVLSRDERPRHPDSNHDRSYECRNAPAANALGHVEIL